MAVGLAVRGAGTAAGGEEQFVVESPGPGQKVPVGLAGRRREFRGKHDQLGAPFRHGTEQFREPEVVADGKADAADVRIEHTDVGAGRERVGLFECHLPRDVHIEEVDLPVVGEEAAITVKDIGRVIQFLARLFGHTAADEHDSEVFCPGRHALHAHIAPGFGIGTEVLMSEGALEHFREHDDGSAAGRGLPDHLLSPLHVLFLIGPGHQLTDAEPELPIAHETTSCIFFIIQQTTLPLTRKGLRISFTEAQRLWRRSSRGSRSGHSGPRRCLLGR